MGNAYFFKQINMDDPKFDEIIEWIIGHEGGYSNNINDPGGCSKYGISQIFIEREAKNLTIYNLTLEQAKDIYKEYWWDDLFYTDIHEIRMCAKIFDMSVNLGPTVAHKLAQRVANLLNPEGNLVIDGELGPASMDSLNTIGAFERGAQSFLLSYKNELTNHYKALVSHHPSEAEFLDGWLARVNDDFIPLE